MRKENKSIPQSSGMNSLLIFNNPFNGEIKMENETNFQKEIKKFNQKYDYRNSYPKEIREDLLKSEEDLKKEQSRDREFYLKGLFEILNKEKKEHEELLYDLKVILCEYFNTDNSSHEVRDLYSLQDPVYKVGKHFVDIINRYNNCGYSEFKRLNIEEYKEIFKEQ